MDFILWIIFGGLVGWIASLIMNTDEEQGALANIIIGVVGALIGGFIARNLIGEDVSGFNITSFLIALGGSIILIAIVKLFSRNTTV